MRRDPRLVPLSREHHAALRLARALIAGTGVAMLVQMRAELQAHFDEEERDLLPVLRAAGEPALVDRLLREHAQLNALFDAAAAGQHCAEAGEALIAHVRFEEREMFPAVEAALVPA
ncbi:hemerythrin domain-containing protein [Denitromonas sp.]|uniref:hemerythrin domain-containing protein n=1 Tax=Denitromonas sp. TaxID=2734609 RepID=UPI002AFFB76C|nr:hemerythrin domain-containing protein [Denitromonas sp.]